MFIVAVLKLVVLRLIRFYQYALLGRGGYFGFLIFSCKFQPTCSDYCYDAINEFGFLKGIKLSARRILRCNPCSVGGVDELPDSD